MSRQRLRVVQDGKPKQSRAKRGRGTASSSSADDGLYTPREGVRSVDVLEVTKRFLRLGTENRASPASAFPKPRGRWKGMLRGRTLFQSQSPPNSRSLPSWLAVEILGLIMFILLHTDGSAWPGRRGDSDFWDNAAKFVRTFARVDHLRTGIKICVYNVVLYYCLCNVNQEEHAEQRSQRSFLVSLGLSQMLKGILKISLKRKRYQLVLVELMWKNLHQPCQHHSPVVHPLQLLTLCSCICISLC